MPFGADGRPVLRGYAFAVDNFGGVAQLWSLGDFDIFMKTRRLVILCALLGALIASGVSASADEKLNPGNTSLGNTTIGGYVETTAGGQFQPPAPVEHRANRCWRFAFRRRGRYHGSAVAQLVSLGHLIFNIYESIWKTNEGSTSSL